MQNFQTKQAPLDLTMFQVEELEERFENKWLSGGGGSTLTSCTITQEVNVCKGTITPLTSILVSNGSCPAPVSVYVCKF
jgi:hypothetical protein